MTRSGKDEWKWKRVPPGENDTKTKKYTLGAEKSPKKSSQEMVAFWQEWIDNPGLRLAVCSDGDERAVAGVPHDILRSGDDLRARRSGGWCRLGEGRGRGDQDEKHGDTAEGRSHD